MRIENKTLILENHDIDHICQYINDDTKPASEQFLKGLKIELELHGLENEKYSRIILDLKGVGE
jgi:hypothetical protein